MKKLLFVLLIGAIASSCTNSSEDDLTDPVPIPDLVTYVDDVKVIIDNNCISCHSNPPTNGAPMSLVTYNDVRNAVINRNLIGRINGNPGPLMPLGGPKLPQNLIDLIEQWEVDGLLEQ